MIDIPAAAGRIKGRVRETPVITVDPADLGVGADIRLVLKLELLQHTGSFKARGATNAILQLPDETRQVVAASGGNHGAAVAWAAASRGIDALVFMPDSSPDVKRRRIESYGAEVRMIPGHYSEAARAAEAYAAQRELLNVHPFDDPEVVSGQGTLGLEIIEQVPDVDRIVVGVGGGGLYAGISHAAGGRVAVSPVEPTRCPTLASALASGDRVEVDVSGVAADSMGVRKIGSIAFDVAQREHAVVSLISDQEIIDAEAALWDVCRVAAEPGGAAALAAVRAGALRPESGEAVVVLVCGGNVESLPSAAQPSNISPGHPRAGVRRA